MTVKVQSSTYFLKTFIHLGALGLCCTMWDLCCIQTLVVAPVLSITAQVLSCSAACGILVP